MAALPTLTAEGGGGGGVVGPLWSWLITLGFLDREAAPCERYKASTSAVLASIKPV